MKHTRTSPERRRRQTRKRTPIAIRRLQGRKRTARWRIRDALSDQVRFYQTPLLDFEVDELRAEVRKDGKPISRSEFRKIAGFAIAGVVKWAIKKRFSYEELAAILDLMDNEL